MKKSGLLAGAAVVLALALGSSEANAGGAADCGDYKSVDNLTAEGVTCKGAKKVAKTWIELCSYKGRCVLDLPSSQWTCRGRGSEPAKIGCKDNDSGDKVKFEADV
jgi:hypothetical protein